MLWVALGSLAALAATQVGAGCLGDLVSQEAESLVLGTVAVVALVLPAAVLARRRTRRRRAARQALEDELLQRCGLRAYPGQSDDSVRRTIRRFLNQPLLERVESKTAEEN